MAVEITPELCIAGRELTEPTLDPAGRRLAFVARSGGDTAIVLVDLDAPDTAAGVERRLTTGPAPAAGRGLDGGCMAWTPDGAAIVYAATDGGLWRQPMPGGRPTPLVAGDTKRPVSAPAVAPDGSFVVYVVDQAEVWLQPLDGSPGRRLDGGAHDFCLDPAIDASSLRVAYQAWSVPDMAWDGAVIVVVDVASGERRADAVDGGAASQPRFAPDGTLVMVHDGSGWRNVWWGGRPLVPDGETCEHGAPTWGAGQATFALSPDGRRVAFTRNERGFGRLCVAGVATGAVEDVARAVHGHLSWAGDRLAAVRTGARTPTEIVVYDTTASSRRVVAVGPAAGWDGAELPEPELVALDDDGAVLHARWYHAPQGRGRLLCWVHGGPTEQWPVTFMPRLAYWLGQGWDVVVPDHRGSTGHGRAYQQALHGRWGDLDVSDTAALLAHVQRAAAVAPASTVAIGGSAGGMTVLGLLARHGDLVAAGVASYPVTDLVALGPNSHRFEAHYTDTLVAPAADVERLRAHSPSSRPDLVRRPLLLLHGTADPVVPAASTVAFAKGVRAAGGDVELELFDDEGHGFRHPENQIREYEVVGAFLARVVG